jgi:hypothetical protein
MAALGQGRPLDDVSGMAALHPTTEQPALVILQLRAKTGHAEWRLVWPSRWKGGIQPVTRHPLRSHRSWDRSFRCSAASRGAYLCGRAPETYQPQSRAGLQPDESRPKIRIIELNWMQVETRIPGRRRPAMADRRRRKPLSAQMTLLFRALVEMPECDFFH